MRERLMTVWISDL